MKTETIAHLLGAGSYWTLNKELHRRLGGDANVTLFLSDMMDKYLYFKIKCQLDDEDGFFNTCKNIERDTCMSEYMQRKCINTLRSLGLIQTKLKGLPAKLYFYINTDAIVDFLQFKGSLSEWPLCEKLPNQYVKDLHTGAEENHKLYIDNNPKDNNPKTKSFNKLKDTSLSDSCRSQNEEVNFKNYSKDKTLQANKSSKIKTTKYKRQPSRKTIRQIGIGHIDPIIQQWNSIPTVTKHRIDPSNKTYQQIKDTMLALFNGSFNHGRYWDETWIKTIPEDILTKKWSVPEVKATILEVAKMSMPGYWPPTDKSYFKNLSTMLYNPKSGKSMFIQASVRPPQPLRESINNSDKEFSKDDYICGMQEVILERIDPEKVKSFSMSRFEKAVIDIRKHYDEKVELVGELKYDAGTARDYAGLYGEFISRQWKNASPDQIGVGSAVYERFQAWIRQEYYS